MLSLLLGLILFLGTHSIAMLAPQFRARSLEKSVLMWKLIYVLISVVGIAFIAHGYAAARLEPILLYTTPYGLRHLTYLLMWLAMILFFAPYFPGKIKLVMKHPQLVAVKLWALSHLLVNGTLADVVLFGAFLAWAVTKRISYKRQGIVAVPEARTSWVNDVIIVVLGTALTALFLFYLHGKLIGMPLLG